MCPGFSVQLSSDIVIIMYDIKYSLLLQFLHYAACKAGPVYSYSTSQTQWLFNVLHIGRCHISNTLQVQSVTDNKRQSLKR